VHLDADTLHRRVDYITDGLNVVLTELAKVVLIEDNKRSLKVKKQRTRTTARSAKNEKKSMKNEVRQSYSPY
jgi:hypothetical protein